MRGRGEEEGGLEEREEGHSWVSFQPNHQRWHAKMEARSEYSHVACTFLHVWRPILHAQSMLIDKISASELSRKFIKSALSVG